MTNGRRYYYGRRYFPFFAAPRWSYQNCKYSLPGSEEKPKYEEDGEEIDAIFFECEEENECCELDCCFWEETDFWESLVFWGLLGVTVVPITVAIGIVICVKIRKRNAAKKENQENYENQINELKEIQRPESFGPRFDNFLTSGV